MRAANVCELMSWALPSADRMGWTAPFASESCFVPSTAAKARLSSKWEGRGVFRRYSCWWFLPHLLLLDGEESRSSEDLVVRWILMKPGFCCLMNLFPSAHMCIGSGFRIECGKRAHNTYTKLVQRYLFSCSVQLTKGERPFDRGNAICMNYYTAKKNPCYVAHLCG